MAKCTPYSENDKGPGFKCDLVGPTENLTASDVSGGENYHPIIEGIATDFYTDFRPGRIKRGCDWTGVDREALESADFHQKSALYEA